MTGGGFPHSGIPGSSLACQLAEAYRRLLRPSSLSGAKASTLCPSLLVHQDAANALQQARNPPETFDVYHLSLCEISMNLELPAPTWRWWPVSQSQISTAVAIPRCLSGSSEDAG